MKIAHDVTLRRLSKGLARIDPPYIPHGRLPSGSCSAQRRGPASRLRPLRDTRCIPLHLHIHSHIQRGYPLSHTVGIPAHYFVDRIKQHACAHFPSTRTDQPVRPRRLPSTSSCVAHHRRRTTARISCGASPPSPHPDHRAAQRPEQESPGRAAAADLRSSRRARQHRVERSRASG